MKNVKDQDLTSLRCYTKSVPEKYQNHGLLVMVAFTSIATFFLGSFIVLSIVSAFCLSSMIARLRWYGWLSFVQPGWWAFAAVMVASLLLGMQISRWVLDDYASPFSETLRELGIK